MILCQSENLSWKWLWKDKMKDFFFLFKWLFFSFKVSFLRYIFFHKSIATDKRGIHIIFFLFLHKNICCGYSLEAPHWGTSNEYPQHMFSWRNKKDISIFRKKKSALSVAMINRNEKVSIIHYSMQMTFDSWQQTYFNQIVSKWKK